MPIKKNATTRYASVTPESLNANRGNSKTLPEAFGGSRATKGQGRTPRVADFTPQRETNGLGSLERVGIENHSGSNACRYYGTSRNKKMITLEWATFVSALLFMSMVAFYLFYPFQPVQLLTDPIPVVNKQVKAGETVTLKINFDKRMNINPQITYYLVDGFVLELSQASVSRAIGQNAVTREILIPQTSTKGMRKIRIELDYKINILRTVHYSWDSEEFEVI